MGHQANAQVKIAIAPHSHILRHFPRNISQPPRMFPLSMKETMSPTPMSETSPKAPPPQRKERRSPSRKSLEVGRGSKYRKPSKRKNGRTSSIRSYIA